MLSGVQSNCLEIMFFLPFFLQPAESQAKAKDLFTLSESGSKHEKNKRINGKHKKKIFAFAWSEDSLRLNYIFDLTDYAHYLEKGLNLCIISLMHGETHICHH